MKVPGFSKLNAALHTSRITRAYGIDSLVEILESYLPDEEIHDVRRAYEYGAQMHAGQFRKSGEPYIFHPLAVARILAEMRMDSTTLIAAILHDVVEDTEASARHVADMFGVQVSHIVEGVSKLDKIAGQSRAEAQAQNLRKLMLAMTDDIRVILVKLADRLHNMRTMSSMKPGSRRRIAQETLDIYAPIAHRLGIHTLRIELEDLGFSHRYPNRYKVLKKAVETVKSRRRDLIREVESRLNKGLSDEGIGAAVFGRRKHLYSVYLKMRSKKLGFLDVMDLYGFRIIVENEDACYRTLGIVHSVYRPIPGQFDDYVATPKVNGYQSLHTALIGPKGVKIEVQIRTRDMNHVAESGVAAHWQYKLGGAGAPHAEPEQQAREWLKNLMEVDQRAGDAQDFLESVRVDLFPDEVFVFTPKGQVVRLPRGATAVDFAYSIHTDLGNSCVSARADGEMVGLATPLKTGQQVEIIRAKHQKPNAIWLNFVKTGKARAAILHHLRHQKTSEARRLGQRLLERAMHDHGINWKKMPQERIKVLLKKLNEPDLERLYESIGSGHRMAHLVVHQWESESNVTIADTKPLAVQGTEGLVVQFAECCRPIPGDRIRGQIRAGRGIVIHRARCRIGLSGRKQASEAVDVVWDHQVQGDYTAELRVEGENKRGLLASVATELAEEDGNIERVRINDEQGDVAALNLLVSVHDKIHLARIIKRVSTLPNVINVVRKSEEN